jgi:vitamin B12 transporter
MTAVNHLACFSIFIFFASTVLAADKIPGSSTDSKINSARESRAASDIKLNNIKSSHLGDLGVIVVSARRVASGKDGAAENILVYSQEDISRLSGRDLGEILSQLQGVDVQPAGQFGQASALSINGSSARQVLLMVDGIPFNTQLAGQANPSQIPVEFIKQIEVIKGASSSVWGSSLGGVVNVITKDVGDSVVPTGTLQTSFAEFSTTKNSLDLAGKVADLGYFVSGSYLNTDGTRNATDAEETKLEN